MIIKRRFRLAISRWCLAQFYKRHNIRWRSTKHCYDSALRHHAELQPQRERFAELLSNVILARRPIIYCDESTVSNWDLQRKTWSSPERIVIGRNDHRHSLTLYAAISPNALTKPTYMITDRTTCQEDWREFLYEVKRNVRSSIQSKPFLVSTLSPIDFLDLPIGFCKS